MTGLSSSHFLMLGRFLVLSTRFASLGVASRHYNDTFLVYFDHYNTCHSAHLGTHCFKRFSQLEEVKFRPGKTVPSKELPSSLLKNFLEVGLNEYQSVK